MLFLSSKERVRLRKRKMKKREEIGEKDSIEKILKSINLEEAREAIKRSNKSRNIFKENYDKIAVEHSGRIVAVTAEKIVSVPFTDDVSKAKKNFEKLEREIGKENMSGARISYIPKPNEILML